MFIRFIGLCLAAYFIFLLDAWAQTENVTASITTRSAVTVSATEGCTIVNDGRAIPCNQDMLVFVNGERMTYAEFLESQTQQQENENGTAP